MSAICFEFMMIFLLCGMMIGSIFMLIRVRLFQEKRISARQVWQVFTTDVRIR